mgnify:CR=1 FL=1
MKRTLPTAVVCLAMSTAFGPASAGEGAVFAAKPTAGKIGDKVKIAFAVAAPTDVEVAVLDANGKVVRHLAAGVLGGEKAPPAPLKAGLAQDILWDGKDDFGKLPPSTIHPPPFKVRVRAGTGVKLGAVFGGDPFNFGSIDAIATDEDGNVYVEANNAASQGVNSVRVFNPDGTYRRTAMPFPADLSAGSMKDVARWDEAAGTWRPRNLTDLDPEFYYITSGKHPNDYTMISASTKEGLYLLSSRFLHRIGPRGEVIGDKFAGRELWSKDWLGQWGGIPNSGRGPIHGAVSPDGRYLYLSGPFSKNEKPDNGFKKVMALGAVYRMKLDDPASTLEPFVTLPATRGGPWTKGGVDSGKTHGPVHGLAVDAKGNVYVADREKDRVAVFGEDGKEAGEIAVSNPDLVAVHPKTGAVYVLRRLRTGYYRYDLSLLKFKDFSKGARPVAEQKLEMDKGATNARMALSVSTERTLVWLAGVKGSVAALEDKGAAFEPVATAFVPDPEKQEAFSRIAVNPENDDVYISDGYNLVWRYDGRTGEGGMLKRGGKPFNAVDLTVGHDGLLYVRSGDGYSGPLERLNRDLAPAPYAATGTHVLSKYIYGRFGTGFCEKGVGTAPDGKVYDLSMYGWCKYFVCAFDADGKPLNGRYIKGKISEANYKAGFPRELDSAVIAPVPAACGGVRVDLAGNFYVGIHVLPKGFVPPAGFEGDASYRKLTGSVVKFGREGGAVLGLDDSESKMPDAPKLATDRKFTVENGLAIYPGVSPFSGATASCVCRVSRFDLDRYGRLALPGAMSCSVILVDNAGNRILEFGKYGNYDSQFVPPHLKAARDAGSTGSPRGKPVLAVPEIPMAWPTGVGFSEKSIYVCDTANRRVVRADKTWVLDETTDIK